RIAAKDGREPHRRSTLARCHEKGPRRRFSPGESGELGERTGSSVYQWPRGSRMSVSSIPERSCTRYPRSRERPTILPMISSASPAGAGGWAWGFVARGGGVFACGGLQGGLGGGGGSPARLEGERAPRTRAGPRGGGEPPPRQEHHERIAIGERASHETALFGA